ncbi:MAG: SRPBCC domain-containing protein [Kofleriaceae bacterium]
MSSLTIVRKIKARPSVVFEAVSTPEGLRQWIGPDDGPVLVAEADPRTGGRFLVRFQMLDGTEHEAGGEYVEVTPPSRLVMTWQWRNEPETSRVEISLREIAEGTELTFTHAQLPSEGSADSHRKGWNGSLDKLVRAVDGKPA